MNIGNLKGKKAIVTGGNKGLGLAMTEALCESNASVAIIASSASVFEVASDLKKQGYLAYGVQADLSNRNEIESSFDHSLRFLDGDVDILINSAGIQRRNRCEDFTLEDWDSVIEVNLNAVFLMCKLAGRYMLSKRWGRIINIASMLSYFGGITVPAYAASKGAVAQLTKALSNEWASRGVCVNAIAPGYMATEMNINLINDEKRNSEILSRIPKGRWGKPEDMKGIVVFLSSQYADYISGAIIPVDGGYLAR